MLVLVVSSNAGAAAVVQPSLDLVVNGSNRGRDETPVARGEAPAESGTVTRSGTIETDVRPVEATEEKSQSQLKVFTKLVTKL